MNAKLLAEIDQVDAGIRDLYPMALLAFERLAISNHRPADIGRAFDALKQDAMSKGDAGLLFAYFAEAGFAWFVRSLYSDQPDGPPVARPIADGPDADGPTAH